MKRNRRQILKSTGTAIVGAGFLGRIDKIAGMQASQALPSLKEVLKQQASGSSEKLLLTPASGQDAPPQPATADRLPLEWNKQVVRRFKDQLDQKGIQAFLIRDPLNVIYLTGYWHTTTERPQATFMNKNDADPWYFYPALDRDLVKSWWYGDGLMYFDFKHSEGGFPHEGKLTEGKAVDLFKFMLEGIKKHGVQGKKIAIDREFSQKEQATAKSVLPEFQFINASDTLMDMRIVKTPEELALCRRAYTYFDRAHAFARDYILTHGTAVTDFEVGQASTLWINDILLSELDLANGASNHGVAAEIELAVRFGPLTSYPHPNQPIYNRIGRNMAFQIEGGCRVGGQGGENYRAGIVASDSGAFDSHMQKLWEVSQHTCDMQVELQVEGSTCSSAAYKIHKYQIDNG
ncbi:MAG: aminopeptidase P family N-terminal domain-containing protein, partial [Acidobacteriaceae bacterium]|nr:aminopeptidase P family N-terminal domain-containing protein [Acidobacteriaceae bacterium]